MNNSIPTVVLFMSEDFANNMVSSTVRSVKASVESNSVTELRTIHCALHKVTVEFSLTTLWPMLSCFHYYTYTSVYTTPTGRRGPPSVEVEGKMYSIVDPIKRETDTNYDTVVTEPYYM